MRRLRGQSVELFGRSEALVSGLDQQLFFLDHVHECDPGEGPLGRVERFAPQHRTSHPLDGSMILFLNIIEIVDLAESDRRAVFRIGALESGFMGRTPVDGALLGHAMAADRRGQEAFGRLRVPRLRQQASERLAGLSPRRERESPIGL